MTPTDVECVSLPALLPEPGLLESCVLDSTLRKRTEPKKIELYWPTFFWMFFVGVVTIEWVLRRRYQLR